jgi:hypothetical protein
MTYVGKVGKSVLPRTSCFSLEQFNQDIRIPHSLLLMVEDFLPNQYRARFICPRIHPVAGSCEHGGEHWHSMKVRKVHD